VDVFERPRAIGELTIGAWTAAVREQSRRQIRRAIGVRGPAPAICVDPALAYLPVHGAARQVHADLPSMLIGGVASLLLQMLHPPTMTGVAQHSRYQQDPLGRLAGTAHFIATTTFGTKSQAAREIARVRKVHNGVRGDMDNGLGYFANDPHLLGWVHVAELSMFLAAVRAYGTIDVDALADDYVNEMATVALDLGVTNPPKSERELAERIDGYRAELRLVDAGRDARTFVLRGVNHAPSRRAAYATLVAAAIGVLPPWAAHELELPRVPLVNTLLVRPAATALCVTLRMAVAPGR
jgi:uncharacterized protein (DUF2236 family)